MINVLALQKMVVKGVAGTEDLVGLSTVSVNCNNTQVA